MRVDEGLSQMGAVETKVEQRGNSSYISDRKSGLGNRWLMACSVCVGVRGPC